MKLRLLFLLIVFTQIIFPSGKNQSKADSLNASDKEKSIEMLIGVSSYTHHNEYFRDYGMNQFVAEPWVTFNLPYGFSASGYLGYYQKPSSHWDGTTISLGYTYSPFEKLSFSANYYQFWYKSDSLLRKSYFNNSFGIFGSYEYNSLTFGAGYDFYFGGVSDPSLYIYVSNSFDILKKKDDLEISFAPELQICWGSMDPGITNTIEKKTPRKGAGAAAQKAKLAIMGYQFSFPFLIDFNKFSFKLSPDYVIPINVTDNSSSGSFFNLTCEISYSLNLF